ncbi:MAG: hypothetical protein SFX74_02215 [Fimbriimonadaceae bacterium]|nr:hypothetical protein [Fimbriimonadaceae bacterium]
MKCVNSWTRAGWILLPFASLVFAGCGGAGGSTSSTGGSIVAGPETFVEAIEVTTTFNGTPRILDPLNLEVNQRVQFQLVTYSGTTRTVLPTSGWRTSDAAFAFGTLGDDSGLFQAGNQVTGTTYYAGVRFNGTDYFTPYQIKPRQGVVVGRIVDGTTGTPVRGVTLEFYDAAGVRVGTVAQPFSGTFRASVPTNAAAFSVIADTMPASYRRVFSFDGLGFRTGDPGCNASLPTLGLTPVNIGDISLTPRTAAEPDLTGCS